MVGAPAAAGGTGAGLSAGLMVLLAAWVEGVGGGAPASGAQRTAAAGGAPPFGLVGGVNAPWDCAIAMNMDSS